MPREIRRSNRLSRQNSAVAPAAEPKPAPAKEEIKEEDPIMDEDSDDDEELLPPPTMNRTFSLLRDVRLRGNVRPHEKHIGCSSL
jgi:hypothetical protein